MTVAEIIMLIFVAPVALFCWGLILAWLIDEWDKLRGKTNG